MNRQEVENAMKQLNELKSRLAPASPEPGKVQSDVLPALMQMTGDILENLRKNTPSQRKMTFEGEPLGVSQGFVGSLPKEVQRELDNCYILSKIMRRPVNSLKSWDRLVTGSGELKKAMDTATSGEGSDWVPTQFTPDLIELVEHFGQVEPLFPHVPMPSNPYKLPAQIGKITAFKMAEQTADTGQTKISVSSMASTTSNITLTAVDIGARVLTSKQLEEDSIVPILPFLRGEIAKALARGVETAILNGDSASTHEDSDITGSDDVRKSWLGLRAGSNDNSYTVDFGAAGNAFDFETFLKLRSKMGRYGVNPNDLAWVVGLNTFVRMLSLKDSANNPVVSTVDKLGPLATVLRGQLGQLGGSPIIVSEFVREDLNASGVFASGATQTAVYAVYRPGFLVGDRRSVTLQLLQELYAESLQDALIAHHSKDFEPAYALASNKVVYLGINVPTA